MFIAFVILDVQTYRITYLNDTINGLHESNSNRIFSSIVIDCCVYPFCNCSCVLGFLMIYHMLIHEIGWIETGGYIACHDIISASQPWILASPFACRYMLLNQYWLLYLNIQNGASNYQIYHQYPNFLYVKNVNMGDRRR